MSIAERREARRKRILENRDERFKIITGVSNNIENQFEPTNDQAEIFSSASLIADNITESTSNSHVNTNFESPYSPNIEDNVEPTPERATNYKLLLHTEIQLLLLAVLSVILLKHNVGFLIYESVLVPFYTLEMAIVVLRSNNEKSNFASLLITVLGMYGISNNKISSMTKVMMIAYNFGKDLCLYLFYVILTAYVFN